MKIFRLALFVGLAWLHLGANAQGAAEDKKYKGYAEQMTRMYFSMLNSLGDPENPIPEKEIIVNESFIKLFKSDKVQIEDDLDAGRKVPIFKDVQAYLRDVDFFYKNVSFSHEVTKMEMLVTDKGEPYIKVTVNRTLQGVSVKDQVAVKNNQIRYLEINIDKAKEELKIASVYTTKLNQKAELRSWWDAMPVEWQVLLTENMKIGEEITDAQLNSIAATEELSLAGKKEIVDLEPASKLAKLKKLDISGTSVTDLMPLRSIMTLEVMNCANTPVRSITPLRYAIHLRELNLANTKLDSLTDVVNFSGLKSLDISGTPITNLKPLADLLSLEELVLNNLQASSISSIDKLLELKYLKIVGTPIADLNPVASLKKLEVIDISSSKVVDLQPLKYLPALKNVYLNNTSVTSIKPLSGKKLKNVYCDKTQIDKASIHKFVDENPGTLVVHDSESLLTWWKELPVDIKAHIHKIALIPAQPSVEHLSAITSIRELDLSSLPALQSISMLNMLTRLEVLNLQGTKVADLAPLKNLADLKELRAANTPVADLGPLKELNKLKILDLKGTKVADLSAISGLLNLEWLHVENTAISTLAPLVGLPSIKTVYADGNKITDQDAFVRARKDVNIIYKTPDLSAWFAALNPIWRDVFAKYVKLDDQPSPEQLHKVVNTEKIEVESNVQMADLKPLERMDNLRELRINDTQVSDLGPISKLASLEKLSITQSPVSSLIPIGNLMKLKYLDISNTGVVDLTPISNLRKLEVIKANGTAVKKILALSAMTSLKELEVFNSSVVKLDPIMGLKQLTVLKCYNTFVTPKQVNKLKAAQPQVNVIYYGGKKGIANFWGLF